MQCNRILALTGAVLALAGMSVAAGAQTPPHTGSFGGAHSGPATGKMNGAHTMGMGSIVGNKKTHVYHTAGDRSSLPAEKNRAYFQTEAQAIAAGYHAAGQKKSAAAGKMAGHGMSSGSPLHPQHEALEPLPLTPVLSIGIEASKPATENVAGFFTLSRASYKSCSLSESLYRLDLQF